MKLNRPCSFRVSSLLALMACLALPANLIVRAADETPAAKPAAAVKLPPAKEIIDKFVKAMGGREAVMKQTSHHSTGKFEMAAQAISGPLDVYAAKPDKLLVKVKITGLGEILEGFDGKVGWSINPAEGPMLKKDKILEQMREQADFYGSLHDEKDYTSMETVASGPFEGKACYQLKLVRKSGQETTEYFDRQTGLLVANVTTQQTPLGAIPVTSVLSDYKEFDGVKVPTRISQKIAGMQQVMTIDTVEINKVPDSVFDLPEPIKALVK